MLKSLRIRSFKSFRDSGPIPFSPFTVVIGRNGSGKTTILQALDFLSGLVRSSLPDQLTGWGWDYADLPHLLSATQRFGFEVELATETPVHWRLSLGTRRRPGIESERVSRRGGVLLDRHGRAMERFDFQRKKMEGISQTLTSSWLASIDSKEDRHRFPELVAVARWARRIRAYFLDPWRLRVSSREATDIGASGESLAGFLASLADTSPDAFGRIEDRVRRHYPPLKHLRVRRKEFGWVDLEIAERWGGKTLEFNARQVSDGLLRLIAISAMPERRAPQQLILIDEVENGLHPSMLKGFMTLLQEVVRETQGATQIVVTTHSPVALNYVSSLASVLLVRREASGTARVSPFSELKAARELSAHFAPGEMWLNAGEERLLTGAR